MEETGGVYEGKEKPEEGQVKGIVMGRGSSKAGKSGGGGTTSVKKPFSEMTIAEKKQAIKEYEKNLDGRFKHYEIGKYKVYKMDSGNYAAYKFDGLKDDFIKNATNLSYFAVLYGKTLKYMKATLS